MNETTIKLIPNSSPVSIILGRQGEYNITKFIFDMTAYMNLYGDGVATVSMSWPHEKSLFIIDSTQTDASVYVVVSRLMTYKAGHGKLEIRWVAGDSMAKTAMLDTYVSSALPSNVLAITIPVYDWIEKATTLYNQLKNYGVSSETVSLALAEYLEKNPDVVSGLTEELVRDVIEGYGYLTQHLDLSSYLLKTLADSMYLEKGSYLTYIPDEYAKKTDIPDTYSKSEIDEKISTLESEIGSSGGLSGISVNSNGDIVLSGSGSTINSSGDIVVN